MTEEQKMSYALGMNLMGNLSELPVEIDIDSVITAIRDISAGKEPALPVEDYRKYMQEFQKKVQTAGQEAVAKASENNKAAGKEFITPCDFYVALNAQWHDYCELMRELFASEEEVNNAIIEGAVRFWFLDEDWESADKVWVYFRSKNK